MPVNIQHIIIVIPCFNEASAISNVLNEIELVKKGNNDYVFTTVAVNDNSTDNTLQQLHTQKNVEVLSLPINLGIGGAMQTGFKYALTKEFDFVIQLDGDGQHPPQEIEKLITAQIQTQANVVIGSRFIEKKGFQSSFFRRLGIKYLQGLYFLLTQKKIKDCTSGFRLYDKKTIELIANKYPDEFPESDSLILFNKLGLKTVETPVKMQERQGGQSSIRNFTQLYYIAKVTLSMFFTFIKKN